MRADVISQCIPILFMFSLIFDNDIQVVLIYLIVEMIDRPMSHPPHSYIKKMWELCKIERESFRVSFFPT